MEKQPPRPMTLFDELTMPPQFRMMKLMLPYTPAATRPMLAILIKFMELQHTIQIFSENPNALSPSQSISEKGQANPQGFSLSMIEEILPYLSPPEREMFENMRNMMNMMEMMQMMQEMQGMQGMQGNEDARQTSDAEATRDMGEDSDAGQAQNAWENTDAPFANGFPSMNPMDLLQNMLSPSQQEMFRTYQNIFEKEGGDSHERMDEQPTT